MQVKTRLVELCIKSVKGNLFLIWTRMSHVNENDLFACLKWMQDAGVDASEQIILRR